MFDRVFITGVSPVVMSDITSGYNIAENIYFEPEFNNLCGFKQMKLRMFSRRLLMNAVLKKKNSGSCRFDANIL